MTKIYLIILFYAFMTKTNAYSTLNRDPQIEKINQELIKLDDPLKFNPFFKTVQKSALLSPDNLNLKLYASMTKLLQTTEGLAWKEEGFYRQSDFVYSLFVSIMRGIYAPDYIVGTHVRKLGRYFAEPHGTDLQFNNIADFQTFLVTKTLPAIDQLIQTLDEITSHEQFQFVFDQYVTKGFISKEKSLDKTDWFFIEESERMKIVKSEHLRIFKAELLNIAGVISYFCAYDFDASLKYVDAITKISIWRGIKKIIFFKKDIEPLTTIEKVAELQKSKYKSFLIQKDQTLATNALIYWKKATTERLLALDKISKNYEMNNNYIIDTDEIKWRSKKEITILKERLGFLNAAIEHKSFHLNSPVTRLSFDLNPAQLFTIKDYKNLLPKTFYGEEQRHLWKNKEINKVLIHKTYGPVTIWDFNYGKAVLYKDSSFNGFLIKSTDDNFMEKIKTLKLSPALSPFLNLLLL
jgi:hypothetical protein